MTVNAVADFLNRLDGTDFVVGVHQADESVFAEIHAFDPRGVDHAIRVHRQPVDAMSYNCHGVAAVQHRMMFDRRSDE